MNIKPVEQLITELKSEFEAWMQLPENRETFQDRPEAYLKSYIDKGAISRQLITACEALSYWRLNQYIETALNQDAPDLEALRLAVNYTCGDMRVTGLLQPVFPVKPPTPNWYETGYKLASPLLAGWEEQAKTMTSQLRAMLDEQAFIDENKTDGLCHPWFILHLLCDWQDIELDTSRYDYPASLFPYDQTMENWKTTDPVELDRLVYILADFHLQESYESEEDVPEFGHHEWWLLPFEILSMLRLREFMGLENPSEFSHPLMKQPLARLPPIEPPPATPLLDGVIEKITHDSPETIQA